MDEFRNDMANINTVTSQMNKNHVSNIATMFWMVLLSVTWTCLRNN